MGAWFLTDIDPKATVKGSRDPLGYQPIWTRFGREIVGNLTQTTRTVRGFTTLLLGLYFADDRIHAGAARNEDRLELFLKFEQLAAYSRVAYAPEGSAPLGVNRVRKRLSEGKGVPISAARSAQILSSQKSYGLWGLYSVAARASGLVDRHEQRPTLQGREHVDKVLLPRLKKNEPQAIDQIRSLIEKDSKFYPTGRHAGVAKALAKVLGAKLEPAERTLYESALVLGTQGEDPTQGRQERFWRGLQQVNDDQAWWDEPLGYDELDQVDGRLPR